MEIFDKDSTIWVNAAEVTAAWALAAATHGQDETDEQAFVHAVLSMRDVHVRLTRLEGGGVPVAIDTDERNPLSRTGQTWRIRQRDSTTD